MIKSAFHAVLILFVVLGLSCLGQPPRAPSAQELPAKPAEQTPSMEEVKPKKPSWKVGGIAIAGKYADAEIVELGNKQYRMYYAVEPEVPGNRLEIFSASSADGINWSAEAGVRREFSAFPDVVRQPDGRFRMYFQSAGVIKSAVSDDGLKWIDEPGVRVDTSNNLGLKLDDVAAPSTLPVDGTYAMVYRGTINQRYAQDVPNSNTQLFFWATSKDGLIFEKKGLALDSRNSIFLGLLDGPELVKWSDGEIRLYFWSYRGIYHTIFQNGTFSQQPEFDFAQATDSRVPFPPNPPSDPTLAKINSTWFLYYGQHTKGIYYATLDES